MLLLLLRMLLLMLLLSLLLLLLLLMLLLRSLLLLLCSCFCCSRRRWWWRRCMRSHQNFARLSGAPTPPPCPHTPHSPQTPCWITGMRIPRHHPIAPPNRNAARSAPPQPFLWMMIIKLTTIGSASWRRRGATAPLRAPRTAGIRISITTMITITPALVHPAGTCAVAAPPPAPLPSHPPRYAVVIKCNRKLINCSHKL